MFSYEPKGKCVCVMRSGCTRSRPALEECRAHSLGDASPALTSQSASIWSCKTSRSRAPGELTLSSSGIKRFRFIFTLLYQSVLKQPTGLLSDVCHGGVDCWLNGNCSLPHEGGRRGKRNETIKSLFQTGTKSQTQTHSPPVLLWACI